MRAQHCTSNFYKVKYGYDCHMEAIHLGIISKIPRSTKALLQSCRCGIALPRISTWETKYPQKTCPRSLVGIRQSGRLGRLWGNKDKEHGGCSPRTSRGTSVIESQYSPLVLHLKHNIQKNPKLFFPAPHPFSPSRYRASQAKTYTVSTFSYIWLQAVSGIHPLAPAPSPVVATLFQTPQHLSPGLLIVSLLLLMSFYNPFSK